MLDLDISYTFREETSKTEQEDAVPVVTVKNLNVWMPSRKPIQRPRTLFNSITKPFRPSTIASEKQVLENISLDAYPNEVLSIIGASGSGKSTFLRALNKMNDSIKGSRTSGDINVAGLRVSEMDDRNGVEIPYLRLVCGMVFQKPNPFPKSVFENVAYGPRRWEPKMHPTDLEERVVTSLQKANLWDEVKDNLEGAGTQLSGGQQQRLVIARTLANNSQIILLDEPCASLDPISSAKIEESIDQLRETHTVIIVTHNLQQAARISDRVAYFHVGSDLVGRLHEIGNTKDIFVNPKKPETNGYITGRFG